MLSKFSSLAQICGICRIAVVGLVTSNRRQATTKPAFQNFVNLNFVFFMYAFKF